jgi:hypothetical protein
VEGEIIARGWASIEAGTVQKLFPNGHWGAVCVARQLICHEASAVGSGNGSSRFVVRDARVNWMIVINKIFESSWSIIFP